VVVPSTPAPEKPAPSSCAYSWESTPNSDLPA
jgi:hypothetical protein